MKLRVWSFCFVVLVCVPLNSSAQCDPGPATGSAFNRCYDDGFVFVDVSGNSHGFTWYWGYVASSQAQGGYLIFHSRSTLGSNTVQMMTDEYFLAGLIPPPAPYAGTFASPGPLLYAEPTSRTTNTFTIPALSIQQTATNSVIISWPSSSTAWDLQQNSDLNPTNWTDAPAKPVDDGTTTSVAISPLMGAQFYRLELVP